MYRVVWAPSARAELAAVWNSSPAGDDQLLVWAVSELTYRLERYPESEGESRYQNSRITFSRPLAIWFEVVSADEVWVYHIWRY